MNSKMSILHLNRLAKLSRMELKTVRIGAAIGGPSMCANWSGCSCGCRFVNSGGSSSEDNFDANAFDSSMLMSPGVTYENADVQVVIQ